MRTEIKAGDRIGQIGWLKGLNISMVHFEMYSGTRKGSLTDRSSAGFQRRSDLLDPTPYLDQALLLSGRAGSIEKVLKLIGKPGFLRQHNIPA